MRSLLLAIGLSGFVPCSALAQDQSQACQTLALIQSQGCLVRRVFVCENMPSDVIGVGSYGPDGPTSVAIFNSDGRTLQTSAGPGTPKISLGEQADPFSLRLALSAGQDSFEYQMIHETAGPATIKGELTAAGETQVIDGRSLQVLQSVQTTLTPAGETQVVALRYLYDAELRLLFTDTISDVSTGETRSTRTPVDFIWPAEVGFDQMVPLYGCEE